MPAADETAKQIEPTLNTVRRLFLFSGNQCAFPGCLHELIDEDGDFVAQTCHIAAAEAGGPRFDKTMTNNDRRSFDNLLLMCGKHHKKTDNVAIYSVAALQQMKVEHETTWKDRLDRFPVDVNGREFEVAINEAIASAIEDPTDRITVRLPQTLKALTDDVYGPNYEPWQLEDELPAFHKAIERLRPLPVDSRKVFEIFVRQAATRSESLEMLESDLRHRVRPDDHFADHLEILEDHRVLRGDVRDTSVSRFGEPMEQAILTTFHEGEFPVWEMYANFCRSVGIDPGVAIGTLDFAFLDGLPASE